MFGMDTYFKTCFGSPKHTLQRLFGSSWSWKSFIVL